MVIPRDVARLVLPLVGVALHVRILMRRFPRLVFVCLLESSPISATLSRTLAKLLFFVVALALLPLAPVSFLFALVLFLFFDMLAANIAHAIARRDGSAALAGAIVAVGIVWRN
jgi:hypothetical protein